MRAPYDALAERGRLLRPLDGAVDERDRRAESAPTSTGAPLSTALKVFLMTVRSTEALPTAASSGVLKGQRQSSISTTQSVIAINTMIEL